MVDNQETTNKEQFTDTSTEAELTPQNQTQTNDQDLLDTQKANQQPVMAHRVERSKDELEWTASEFIYHPKSLNWYLVLAIFGVVFVTAVYLLSRDYFTAFALVLIVFIFGFIAGRKPRSLTYRLDRRGLTIANRLHPYNSFKSFWVDTDSNISSLSFMPLKRFMPILTVYYDPNDEEIITNIISDKLPMEQHKLDPIDKFLQKIRF